MTKQDFLNGKAFRVKKDSSSSFKFVDHGRYGYLVEQSRLTTGKLIMETHCLSLNKIGSKLFAGYNFVVGKEVKVKYRYEDLIEHIDVEDK